MTRLQRFASTILLLFTAACGSDAPTGQEGEPDPPDAGPGRLVIVGGALDRDNDAVYEATLAGRLGSGPFCIIPTASGVPDESMASAIEAFRSHGADSVEGVWITTDNPEAARDTGVVTTLRSCSGYWFVGGSQSRIMDVFRPGGTPTPADDAIRDRWRAGAVVAGSSAGAAMMPKHAIGGGSSAAALEYGVTREDVPEGVWVTPGMEFLEWGLVDQHHLARGRWGRLLVALLEEPEAAIGVGIDENTALVVDGGIGEVVGASGVLLIDVSDAVAGDEPRTATGVRMQLMAPGDRLDVETARVTRAPRGPVSTGPGGPTLEELAAGPFERWALLHLFHRLAGGEEERVVLDGGARILEVEVPSAVVRSASDTTGVEGTPYGLSVGPLDLSLRLPDGG